MHVEKVLGVGPESVYVFHFPSQRVHLSDFPHKIGKAGRQGAQARIKSLQAGMQEEPVIDLIFRCPDSSYLERALHTAHREQRLDLYGTEWFQTTADAVEASWWALQDLDALPLHQQIRRARSLANMTQLQLADSAGISPGEMSALESGFDVKVSTLVEVARELGLTVRLSAE
jgi:DNA-binding XRE family transcriptional regulator